MREGNFPLKTIGVLGGIGPQATMDFEARVHAISRWMIEPQGNRGYPPMVVYYHRSAPVFLKEDGEPVQPYQVDPHLLQAARLLSEMADFLVIASNGAHLLTQQIEEATGRRVLSMIEATLSEVRRRDWRRVGVLTFQTIPVYAMALREIGIVSETIPHALAACLDQAITNLAAGIETAQDRAMTKSAVSFLRARDVDGIILGCTEIPFLLQEEAPDLISPLQLLAEAAVKYALQ
jgi:aspartate racemase